MDARRYRFGVFVFDVPRRVLERDGVAVPLQAKAFRLLAYLVRHRDRVISRDELLGELWSDVVVTEASLSKVLRGVRRALGEHADEESSIQSVRGVGVRFVAPVAEEVDDGCDSRSARRASARPRFRSPRVRALFRALDPLREHRARALEGDLR